MCDYSLEMYGSRPAREGELYATTRFPSGSIGFTAAGDAKTVVCLECETPIVLTDIPSDLQTRFGVGQRARATFAQTDRGAYRDGLRLANGRFVSLQELRPGIRAYIPSLAELRAQALEATAAAAETVS
ncbi:MAG TPA: hypothetical protein VGH40_04140 [Roseiarcus sp.]|jgi:hypothetical protein